MTKTKLSRATLTQEMAISPSSWPEIEEDIRHTILGMASLLGEIDLDTAKAFLSLPEGEDYQDLMYTDTAVNIEKYNLYHLVKEAYDFAYQIQYCPEFNDLKFIAFTETLEALPRQDGFGSSTPIARRISGLNVLLRTVYARHYLDLGENLSIEALALLAQMTPPSVRSSISREGFRLSPPKFYEKEKDQYGLDNEVAREWLSRRRRFIPTLSG